MSSLCLAPDSVTQDEIKLRQILFQNRQERIRIAGAITVNDENEIIIIFSGVIERDFVRSSETVISTVLEKRHFQPGEARETLPGLIDRSVGAIVVDDKNFGQLFRKLPREPRQKGPYLRLTISHGNETEDLLI